MLIASYNAGFTPATTPFIRQPEEPVMYVARKRQPTRTVRDYILIASEAGKQADVDTLKFSYQQMY